MRALPLGYASFGLPGAEFVVVDYVNDEIDTRVQSQAMDGVPDEIVNNIAKQLVSIAKEN